MLFFRINRNLVCLFKDAEIMHRIFDLEIYKWVDRPYVTI